MSELLAHETTNSPEQSVSSHETRILLPDEQIQIDLTHPLADNNEMYEKLGIDGNLVANISAGKKDFMIVDTREASSNREFFIIDERFSMKDRLGFKGVRENEPVIIGRKSHTDRFEYPDTVSREHFSVEFSEGRLFVRNLNPTNPTIVTATMKFGSPLEEHLAERMIFSNRTEDVQERMKGHHNFGDREDVAPYGYYLNHPILGRKSRSVENGVYLGGSAREAIVVDGKSSVLRKVYADLLSELKQSYEQQETLPVQAVLLKTMRRVQEVMPYNAEKTEDISRLHHGDKLVGLSTYLKEHAGVCRHQALLAAFILENLIKDGSITGAVGVERNTVPDMGGTHAWAIYKSAKNDAIVVDPAQSFVGTKAQAQREGRWEYRLSSEDYS